MSHTHRLYLEAITLSLCTGLAASLFYLALHSLQRLIDRVRHRLAMRRQKAFDQALLLDIEWFEQQHTAPRLRRYQRRLQRQMRRELQL